MRKHLKYRVVIAMTGTVEGVVSRTQHEWVSDFDGEAERLTVMTGSRLSQSKSIPVFYVFIH